MFSSRIFRSRWFALLWAGGILWTAYDVASGAPAQTQENSSTDATGEAVNQADLAILANAID